MSSWLSGALVLRPDGRHLFGQLHRLRREPVRVGLDDGRLMLCLPAFHAVAVPVDFIVAVGDQAPRGIVAGPAVGMAEHDDGLRLVVARELSDAPLERGVEGCVLDRRSGAREPNGARKRAVLRQPRHVRAHVRRLTIELGNIDEHRVLREEVRDTLRVERGPALDRVRRIAKVPSLVQSFRLGHEVGPSGLRANRSRPRSEERDRKSDERGRRAHQSFTAGMMKLCDQWPFLLSST